MDVDKTFVQWWDFIENGDPDDSDGLREVARQAINQLKECREDLEIQKAITKAQMKQNRKLERRIKEAMWH